MKKLSSTEAELKKSVAYKKTVYIQFSVFLFLIPMLFLDKYVSRSFAMTFQIISHKKVLLYDSCHLEPQIFSMNLWIKNFS